MVEKSARLLGREFGRTAAEMNLLLKEHGYLDGVPGAYQVTDKGAEFATHHDHDNGYGGYAHRSWYTTTWSPETEAALRADMEATPAVPQSNEPDPFSGGVYVEDDGQLVDADDHFDDDPDVLGTSGGLSTRDLLVIGVIAAAVVGAVTAAPHIKPFWHEKVKPAARRARARFTRGSRDVGEDADESDANTD